MHEVQNKPEVVASNAINTYFKDAAPSVDETQRVRIAAAVMELLRMTSGAAAATQEDPQNARIALLELIGQLCGIAWEKVPFSITKAALSSTQPKQAVYDALITFANVAQMQPEEATGSLFAMLLAVQESSTRPTEPPRQVKHAAAVVSDSAIEKVFKAAKFVPGGNPPMELLSWQSDIPGYGLGPLFSAVLLDEGPKTKILLETGEIVWVPQETFLLAKSTDLHDYDHVPPQLLANFRAIAPWQWPTDPPMNSVFDSRIGQFTQPLVYCPYGAFSIDPVHDVFTHPNNYLAGNNVAVTLSVDGTPYFVTLTAQVSKTGPYVTAKLTDSSEKVVMRLDQPRMFSARGVYLFPLPDQVIALTVR